METIRVLAGSPAGRTVLLHSGGIVSNSTCQSRAPSGAHRGRFRPTPLALALARCFAGAGPARERRLFSQSTGGSHAGTPGRASALTPKLLPLLLAPALALALAPTPALAATVTWTGASGGPCLPGANSW